MKIGNITMASFFIILSSVFFIQSLSYGAGSGGDTGAGFLPRAVSIIIIALSIVIIVKTLMENDTTVLIDEYLKKSFIIIFISIVYIFLMSILGFTITTPIFLSILFFMTGERNKVKLVSFAVGLTALTYCAFRIGLNVRLPVSFLGI